MDALVLPSSTARPGFAITRASHVVLRVRDLATSRAFYEGLLGLVVSDAAADRLWLRGIEEACHHSLVLEAGDPACLRVGMRAYTDEDLALAKAHFAHAGFPTIWADVPHQGRTFHTVDPAGTPLEFCASMSTRPRLFHHVERHRGSCAHRLDHMQVVTPQVSACAAFYCGMGFRVSEYVVHGDREELMMVFLQRKGNPHDIVFADGPGPRLHHLAYTVPETQHLMEVADLCVRAGFAANVEFGPARHFSPGLARFLYLRDPDGHRVELFPGHYQTMDIEDEAVRWQSPEFQIGGWQAPPQSWLTEASPFAGE